MIKRNVISSIGYRGCVFLLSFLLIPVLIKSFGAASYGVYVLFYGLIGYGGLLELGLNSSIVSLVAKNRDNPGVLQKIYQTGLWQYIVMSLVAFFLILIFQDKLMMWFFKPTQADLAQYKLIMLVLAAAVPMKILSVYSSALLNGFELIYLSGLTDLFGVLIRLGLSFTFVFLRFGLPQVLTSFVFSFLFIALFNIVLLVRLKRINLINIFGFDFFWFKKIFFISSGVFFTNAGGEISSSADKFIITYFLGPAALAPYAIASMIATKVWELASVFSSAVLPRFSYLIELNKFLEIKATYKKTLLSSYLICGMAALVIAIVASQYLNYWLGSDALSKEVAPLLYAFLIIITVAIANWVNGSFLIAAKKVRFLSCAMIVSMLINVGFCLYLVPIFHLYGALFGWGLGYLSYTLILFYLVMRYFGSHHED